MQSTTSRLSMRLTRGAAFSIHLTLSLLVFSSLVIMMVLYWFPGELFFIDGGWQGLKLVAMVDLVLGPILTLLLFKPGKPKLAFDMSMIATLQIAALCYGFYTTHQQRTIAVVYAERGFNTLSAKDKMVADKQLLELSQQPKPVPKATLLAVPLLLTPEPAEGQYGQMLEDILNGYPGPQRRSDLYVPAAQHHDSMRGDALSTEQLRDKGALNAVQAALNKQSITADKVEFYNFKARYATGIAIFDPAEKRILDYIAIDNSSSEEGSETVQVAEDDA